MGCSLHEIFVTILEVDQRTRKLMTMHKALHPKDDLTDDMYQEKKAEEHLTALKTELTHQYNDLKTTYKSAEED